MTIARKDTVESQWARLGVLFNCAPAPRTPDLERLLLDSAREVGASARLLPLTVTWLVEFGNFVAKHRLKRLIVTELEPEYQGVLGLILDSALALGAPRDLSIALEVCRPCAPPAAPRALSDASRANPKLEAIAARRASAVSRRWGVWTPEAEPKKEAIRPVKWLLDRNPSYRARIVRKGDLRCSILETLRHDAGGRVGSESELARLSGATRAAVRKALRALVDEGEVIVGERPANNRDRSVSLRRVA